MKQVTKKVQPSVIKVMYFVLTLFLVIPFANANNDPKIVQKIVKKNEKTNVPEIIIIDIALIGDNFLYQGFGGTNNPNAVANAKSYMQTIVSDVLTLYEQIFDNSAIGTYDYQFNIVSTDVITGNTGFYTTNNEFLPGKPTDWWVNNYPCALNRPNIVHVISGKSLSQVISNSGQSFYGWTPLGGMLSGTSLANRTVITVHGGAGGVQPLMIIKNEHPFDLCVNPYNPTLIAHEYGHVFGLNHTQEDNDPTCSVQCGGPSNNANCLSTALGSSTMCTGQLNSWNFTSCETSRLVNFASNPLVANFLKPITNLNEPGDGCLHCKHTIDLSTSKTAVVFGCGDDAAEFDYAALVWNWCTSGNYLVRIRFQGEDLEVIDPGPFTVTAVPNSTDIELRIGGGIEMPVAFGPEEQKVFTCRFKLKDPSQNGNAFPNIFIRTFLLNTSGGVILEKGLPMPYAKSLGTGQHSIITNDDGFNSGAAAYVIDGTLSITYFPESVKWVFFKPGAQVEINAPDNQFINVKNTTLTGCNGMWRGIYIPTNKKLDLQNVTLEDAQYGVSVWKGGTINAASSKFINNNFGVYTSPFGSGDYAISLLGNSFETNNNGFKPFYGGQSPLPVSKGFVGIYLKDATSGVNISCDPITDSPSKFSNLKYGIMALNSNVSVRGTQFTEISNVPKGSGYPDGPTETGRGIYAHGGILSVIGGGVASNAPEVSFENCYLPIQSFYTNILAEECKISKAHTGIDALGGVLNTAQINWNKVSAETKGISASWLTSANQPLNISNNNIEMEGTSNAIGLSVSSFSFFGNNPIAAHVANNVIKMNTGTVGLVLDVPGELNATENQIILSNPAQNYHGILVQGGEGPTINCNNVVGATNNGQLNGIYAISVGQAKVVCNNLEGMDNGLRFEGILLGRKNAFVAGNNMSNNSNGLLLGIDAIIGPQPHRGNKWYSGTGSTVARHLTAPAAQFSTFSVDQTENPSFMPDFAFPPTLVVNVNNPTDSYTCQLGSSCPFPTSAIEYATDKRIANGELLGTYYTEPNNWLAQRRLYERLSTEGNPYPNDPDITGFIEKAQLSGLSAYADVLSNARQYFSINNQDRNELGLQYDTIVQLMNELYDVSRDVYRNAPDSLTILWLQAQMTEKRNKITQVQANRSVRMLNLNTSFSNNAISLLSQNNGLTALTTYEGNEKIVNEIFFQSMITPNSNLSPLQIATLTNIANQCPHTGGEGVLRARGMLRHTQVTPVYYNDDALCAAEPPIEERSTPEARIDVFPNPVSNGQVFVNYQFTDAENQHTIQVYDLLGSLVVEQDLRGVIGNATIQLPANTNAIFTFSIFSHSAVLKKGKIVVIK
jgi:hypothetical protein